jgi:hypothetical protein
VAERKEKEPLEKVFSKLIKILSNKIFILETPPVRSASASTDSGHSTDEEKAIRDDYVHPTSLKAWKQKKDKEVLEQDQQAKAKRPASGSRSAKAKSPRAGEKAAKSPTREKTAKSPPREKSPKGSKTKRPTSATPSEKVRVNNTISKYHKEKINVQSVF